MFFITFIFLFSFLGPIVNIVDAQWTSAPIANAEIVMGEGYDDQVEFTGTKTVSGTEWDIYRITLDSDGETKIFFDASNSSSGANISTNQWKILFDAPYGEDVNLEGHTFTEPTNNGTWGYRFKNVTVDSTGENENTIRMELVVSDDLGRTSEKFRMFFVIVPYGLVDDEPVVEIYSPLANSLIESDTIMIEGSLISGSENGEVYIETAFILSDFNESFVQQYNKKIEGTWNKTTAGLANGESFNLTLSLDGKYTDQAQVVSIHIKIYEGIGDQQRWISYLEIEIILKPNLIGMQGMPAPNIVGEAYNGSGWQDFDLQTYYDYDWSIDNNDTKDSQWIMIEFTDTDCPYCFNTAQEYQEASNYFTTENPNWNGPHVSFIASATELTGLNGHDSSRAEIEAFRDKTEGEMCNSSNVDCSTRNGQAFAIPFIDDLNKTHMDNWEIGGTPTYVLIQPNCIIAWASSDHPNEKFYDAINRLVPQDGAANNYDQKPQVDSDGDGIPDCTDSFPSDVNETQDSDGDGVGDNSDAFPNDGNETHDDDDDGVGNNTDAFPQDGNETHDDDNDGVGNNTDAFPQDANETMDTDQDGVGDNEDPEPENPDVRTPQDINVEISDTSSYLIAGSVMFLALVILFVRRKQPPNTIAKSHFVEDESIWNDS